MLKKVFAPSSKNEHRSGRPVEACVTTANHDRNDSTAAGAVLPLLGTVPRQSQIQEKQVPRCPQITMQPH